MILYNYLHSTPKGFKNNWLVILSAFIAIIGFLVLYINSGRVIAIIVCGIWFSFLINSLADSLPISFMQIVVFFRCISIFIALASSIALILFYII